MAFLAELRSVLRDMDKVERLSRRQFVERELSRRTQSTV
jgi:hypothetical protein